MSKLWATTIATYFVWFMAGFALAEANGYHSFENRAVVGVVAAMVGGFLTMGLLGNIFPLKSGNAKTPE